MTPISHPLRHVTRALVVACALLIAACASSPRRTVTGAQAAGVVASTPQAAPQMAERSPTTFGSGLDADVARLVGGDFTERAHAADRLVAAGEASLDALGRAGEGVAVVHGAANVSSTRPVIRAILAHLDTNRIHAHVESEWPVVRREAAEELGRRGQWTAVPRLIARLDDPDVDVRATAASSLRRLTNRFFGYDAQARATVRATATQRWRGWWSVESRVEAPCREGTQG